MVFCGIVWDYVVLRDTVWYCVAPSGILWQSCFFFLYCVVFCGNVWYCVVLYRTVRCRVVLCAFLGVIGYFVVVRGVVLYLFVFRGIV